MPLPPLQKRQRPGHHHLAQQTRALGGFGLHGVGAVIEADGGLVALQRHHQPDHHARRGSNVAQMGTPLQQRQRGPFETGLVQRRVEIDHADQAPHQLQVAHDGDAQAGAQIGQPGLHEAAFGQAVAFVVELFDQHAQAHQRQRQQAQQDADEQLRARLHDGRSMPRRALASSADEPGFNRPDNGTHRCGG